MLVALATCTRLPEVDEDAAPLEAALRDEGVDASWLAWDDPAADFRRAKLTVLRSTWNYVERYPEFLAFIDRIAGRSENHASVLRWNTHKRYLRELHEAGFPVVDTVLVPKGSGVSLQAILKKKRWFSAVMKPAVGAGSYLARRVGGSQQDELDFVKHVAQRDMLVQPWVAEVETHGERAIVYIDGAVTHAVRKAPRLAGDVERITPEEVADDERELTLRLMRWTMRQFPCGALLYGRADLVRDASGALRVMELELTEPSLFFAHGSDAAPRFARAIKRRL